MGIYDAIKNFAHKQEMRESKDEILLGEVIRIMVKNYGPLVDLQTFSVGDQKQARFRLLGHNLLHSITVKIDRWTGSGAISEALIGSRGSLTFVAEVKNYVADPDDVLAMWKTDFSNLGKIPLFGDIKLNHQMNSVLATKTHVIEIGDFENNLWVERKKLEKIIGEDIILLCKQLETYKKQQ